MLQKKKKKNVNMTHHKNLKKKENFDRNLNSNKKHLLNLYLLNKNKNQRHQIITSTIFIAFSSIKS